MSINKTQEVLKHLQKGFTVSSMQAFQLWRATRLGDIIFRLRRQGHPIHTRERVASDGIRYAEYYMEKGGRDA